MSHTTKIQSHLDSTPYTHIRRHLLDLIVLQDNPIIGRRIAKVSQSNGKQAIIFDNGSKIQFGARKRGFGRSFKKINIEVFDEAQILSQKAINGMLPAMNTAAQSLATYIGTPPEPSATLTQTSTRISR